MKFLADMGISPKTVAFLHALGHDAVHLADQGLERLPDPGIVEKARQEGRSMLVHDLGFGELVAASGATLPSVITFRLRNMHPDGVNGALQSIISQHGEALEHGAMSRPRHIAAAVRGPTMSRPASTWSATIAETPATVTQSRNRNRYKKVDSGPVYDYLFLLSFL